MGSMLQVTIHVCKGVAKLDMQVSRETSKPTSCSVAAMFLA